MKPYFRMIFFVLIMGAITSIFLVGMDALTKDRILANQEAELKSTILDAYNISYNLTNIHTVFDSSVTKETRDGITFYIDQVSGSVSYVFEGGGVWGPIIGVITLQNDFETIVKITILQQEETPGLGGVVAETQYLANFIGKKMLPSIQIIKNATDSPNEVNAISGATRTSNAFANILNTSYASAKTAWDARNG
ncbi:MAG TPA: FMN-binding protein [Bacilli bacterium]|nr:FMN-binding protein [Bacilli bacterium]